PGVGGLRSPPWHECIRGLLSRRTVVGALGLLREPRDAVGRPPPRENRRYTAPEFALFARQLLAVHDVGRWHDIVESHRRRAQAGRAHHARRAADSRARLLARWADTRRRDR